jgi:hypothetical protein
MKIYYSLNAIGKLLKNCPLSVHNHDWAQNYKNYEQQNKIKFTTLTEIPKHDLLLLE